MIGHTVNTAPVMVEYTVSITGNGRTTANSTGNGRKTVISTGNGGTNGKYYQVPVVVEHTVRNIGNGKTNGKKYR